MSVNIVQVKEKLTPMYQTKKKFFEMLDGLPTGSPEWTCNIITIASNAMNKEGETLTEDVELWRRNPVECVQELMGNPAFKDAMAFTPEKAFADPKGGNQVYDEMWTGELVVGYTGQLRSHPQNCNVTHL
jgi:hypothetical protein